MAPKVTSYCFSIESFCKIVLFKVPVGRLIFFALISLEIVEFY